MLPPNPPRARLGNRNRPQLVAGWWNERCATVPMAAQAESPVVPIGPGGAIMSRVLILYGTTEGHTRVIADAIGRALQLGGVEADVVEAGTFDPVVHQYDAAIVAASVHIGKYQPTVIKWVSAHAAELNARPTAFVSVSLGILQKSDPKVMADLDAITQRFMTATGWRPTSIKHVAGAVLYSRYNFLKRWLMKRIVGKAGGGTDTSQDYDYTNWGELRAFADEFRRRLSTAA
jgi:menaquinone-dependent protoporphyrinogen oxidase